MTDLAPTPDAGGLAPVITEPPSVDDLFTTQATQAVMATAERNAQHVDPQIPARDRLFVGARLTKGSRGAERAVYDAWRQNRSPPSPTRAGTDQLQAKILAAADNLERGKALGSEAAAVWLEATGAEPIDVARFARAPKTGRAAELWDRMLTGSLADDEAADLAARVTETGRALEDFDDDLTLGDATVKQVGDRVVVSWPAEPAPGVVTALPLDTLPVDYVDDADGLETHVAGDEITVAAPKDAQRLLRRAFPAAGAHWLTVQPAEVSRLSDAARQAGDTPAAHVDYHFEGHPALAPYDVLTFTTPDDRRGQRFTTLGGQRLGRTLTDAPRHRLRQISELADAATADEAIDQTAWAVFHTADNPKLGDRARIPVRTGEHDYVLVFGITPDEAADATDGYAFVNDGIATRHDIDDVLDTDDDPPAWFETRTKDGKPYRFSVGHDEALLFPDRQTRPADRWQIPITDLNRADLEAMAEHLEMLGAEGVAAYVTGEAEGFSEAREVLWGDGTGAVASSRVKGLRSGPNVIPVWVRDGDGLPDDTPVDPTLYADRPAELDGDRIRVDATGQADLAAAVRQGHQLGLRHGYDRVEVVSDRGPVRLIHD